MGIFKEHLGLCFSASFFCSNLKDTKKSRNQQLLVAQTFFSKLCLHTKVLLHTFVMLA